ncbi:hypothetical protein Molly5_144 [Maribacter phage Molly_5]|uniref:Uncharacterized protein n=1 Tax=Maribacter phage Molly_1 TaxID=2745685 RepID=A0A8E4XY33_9CAUD|nr:hypothetical protein M1M29_gp143 [Maribacter phage Molly_1]QQO97637.1 hypothetical protein Molly2_143 [Maribacter phage Molly_2]QQO97837.1 hypothetical protein Molly3_143 [Maribacter phage Molly_3]QQO98038.1 hypothetical protein Molly4_144 [Maribacter phage Molly_4]QQO98238.1 hypothetical protein Molly5_144 [Maribacter phage Molly_5]QQO97437.1 hypothetical protein Molly1_143 [Maribacter phage Molly_1]
MSKLIHCNKELDTTKEHELTFPKGTSIRVDFVDGRQDIFRDITEVHWNYVRTLSTDTPRVALESDIRKCGFTYSIDAIATLTVFPTLTKDDTIRLNLLLSLKERIQGSHVEHSLNIIEGAIEDLINPGV